jgi:hypothetical protein
MKRYRSIVTLISLMTLVAGCHTFHGVRRFATTSHLPPAAVIEEAISRAPGVREVFVNFVQPPKHFSLYHGIGKDPDYYQLVITSESASTVLTIGKEKGKEVAFYTLWRNRRPSQTELQATAALMDSVYATLLASFPLLPPKSEFKEVGM